MADVCVRNLNYPHLYGCHSTAGLQWTGYLTSLHFQLQHPLSSHSFHSDSRDPLISACTNLIVGYLVKANQTDLTLDVTQLMNKLTSRETTQIQILNFHN